MGETYDSPVQIAPMAGDILRRDTGLRRANGFRRPWLSGFTLIELLVVIAIIAILAAILFPIFSRARMRANVAKCISNLSQLSKAMVMYADDNKGYLPIPGWTGDWPNWAGCNPPQTNAQMPSSRWVYPEAGQLWPYVRAAKVYICPQDIKRSANVNYWQPPAGKSFKDMPLSYSMNGRFSRGNPAGSGATPMDSVRGDIDSARIMLLIQEARNPEDTYPRVGTAGMNDSVFDAHPGNLQDNPNHVHYDGTCVAYLDGHAKWKPYKELDVEHKSGQWMPYTPY